MERYKVVISSRTNNKLYREVDLEPDAKQIRFGTGTDCYIWFDKSLFFEEFSFLFESQEDKWIITCSDNHYISVDGILKLSTKELEHGDSLILKNKKSNMEVLNITFTLDFEYEAKDYERIFDINDVPEFTIGGLPECDIQLDDPLIGQDQITIIKKGDKLLLKDNNTQYGIYVNGLRVEGEALIENYDFFAVIGFSFYFKFGKLYTQKKARMISETLQNEICSDSDGSFNYPVFNRNTRIMVPVPTEKISVLDPPQLPEENKHNILMQLLPSVAMMGVTIMLANQSGGGIGMMLRNIAMVSISVIVAIVGMVGEKKNFKKETEKRDTTYRKYVDKKREEIQGKRQIEKGILEELFLSPEEEVLRVKNFSADLFDRVPDDEDFLNIRLGTGPLSSSQPVDYKEQEKLEIGDELSQIPLALANEFKDLASAPIVVDGKSAGSIGIVGARSKLYEMFKNILLDISTRQYTEDVALFLMTSEEHAKSIGWSRFLPHLYNEPIDLRNIICDEESKSAFFEYLYKLLSSRNADKSKSPHIVVLSYSDFDMKSHPISQYFDKAEELGVTFIFFEEKKHNLPLGCEWIVTLQSNDTTGTLVARHDETLGLSFSYDSLDDIDASYFVQKLAPVYCEEVSLESNLTKSISLYKMLNIYSASDIDLNSRWNNSEIYKTMAAPLGVDAKGQEVCLDLHEKFHGPHGLVAGTTGSGKSEILQSYILAMATLFHPYEVGFVIIDFKGGGMVNQFKDLPHLNGAITNIDGREITRSLLSIKAELKKRQELFSKANVNHINAYIQLYKKGAVEIPLPHLILVVDEFAELKMDQPEFMKELISAARIGRSLGVHLILATQKPSGVVDDQIWSNSKFKLCLKVQNQQDSNEVLKSPLAAEIREPGRAYLQVGNNEIFMLFQSAYSGAPAVMNGEQKKKFHISEVNLWGKKKVIYEQKPEKSSEEVQTQLDAIVSHVAKHAEDNKIEKLQGICLPSLREKISFAEAEVLEESYNEILVPMGIYDDPSHQCQPQYEMDLLSGNTFVVGASQYGKTTMMQGIIRHLAETYEPDEVNMYILDFASMALKVFDNLSHVGGVVTPSEDVKLKTFFSMMMKEIAVRKDKFSKLGLASFASYKEAGHTDLPFILVMVDNLSAFRELCEPYDDVLLNICREGLAVGVGVVATTVQTRSLGYKYLSNFANRIAFYCNSREEYANIFPSCRTEPSDIAGRGIIMVNKEIYEYQNYLPFEGEKEIDRVNNIKDFILNISNATSKKARRIPEIPDVLTYTHVQENLLAESPNMVVAGMDFNTVDAVYLDVSRMGYIAIAGREKSGKTNFVKFFYKSLADSLPKYPIKAYIIDNYERQLIDLKQHSFVQSYSTEMQDLEEILVDVEQECNQRRELLRSEGLQSVEKLPLILLTIQNEQFFESGGVSKNSIETLKKLIKMAKEVKIFIMFTNMENAPIPYSGTDIQKQIKETKNVLFFDDLAAFKPFDISMSDLRENKKAIELGDAFLVLERSLIRLKTPLLEETN